MSRRVFHVKELTSGRQKFHHVLASNTARSRFGNDDYFTPLQS